MGYRHYLYKAKKEEINKVRNMTNSDLYIYSKSKEKEEWWSPVDIFRKNSIYGLGEIDTKLWSILENNRIDEIFNNKEVKESITDYDNGILNAEGFLKIMEYYKEKMLNYFQDLLVDGYKESWREDKTSYEKLQDHMKEKINRIIHCSEYDFDLKKEEITRSWSYEYALFELIRLYKTIDWENYYVVYLAY